MKVKATVIKLEDNVARMAAAATGDQLLKALNAGAEVVRANARINVEKTFSSKSTGGAGLGESIIVEVDKSGRTEASVNVGPTVVYGRIQELGGVIKPVYAKLLSWIGDSGERIFANAVTIPPRPYLRPAVDEHMDEIEAAVAHHLREAIEGASK
jgi:phage gpG-like protein